MKSLIAAFWDKIAIWKKKVKPQINVDYTLIDSDDGKKTGVGILHGKYQGVLYHYGLARIIEDEGFAKLQFDYTVVTSPFIPIDDLMQDEEFHDFIGDILTEILLAQQNEETREYNPEEFDI